MQPVTSPFKKLGIDKLSADERLQLVDEIWDSLCADPAALPIPEWQQQELQRRLQAFAQDGDQGRPADEVLAEIARKL